MSTVNTVNNKETREIIQIGDSAYYSDSINDQGKNIMNDIDAIGKEINSYQTQVNIMTYARSQKIKELIAETENFEKVEGETNE